MNKNTNEEHNIVNNLNYIGLDLDNLPDFLLNYEDVNFKPTKAYEDNNFRIYKYINVRDIQLLLTPKNRMDSLTEKYSNALHISSYLDSTKEENILRNATFLNMIKNINIEEIEKIEEQQKLIKNKIPFKVKYNNNYLWEIYFSEFTGKYFMMTTTEDLDYSALFYIIKKQIECFKENKDEYIFVPISYYDYTCKYLKKSEISDIEKYIWIFTKQWPQIYEVFDIENNLSLKIVGQTNIYEKIKSYYKLEFDNKEDAFKFYQLLKALFILQTELPFFYRFIPAIEKNGELTFENNSKTIQFDSLSKFIKEEYLKHKEELELVYNEKEELEKNLKKLLDEEKNKNLEYIFREKQVATYMECKNSVFGRIRYFFKGKNMKFKKSKEEKSEEKTNNTDVEREISKEVIEDKDFYTIEDLIKICLEHNRIIGKNQNINQDITAMTDKIKKLSEKIKNAELFIKEVDDHRKSIFEFWKFTNKNEKLELNSGTTQEEEGKERKKLKKTFDYEEDFEDFGIEVDKLQKNVLTQAECDAIFAANDSVVLKDINSVKNNIEIEKNSFEEIKEKLLLKKDIVFNSENFDIFGNVKEDKTKISVLGNKNHRESKKDLRKVLEIVPNISLEDYISKIKSINENISAALKKVSTKSDINIYLTSEEKLNTNNIEVFNINPKNAIEKVKESEKINLYKLSLSEDINIAYYSNIIYYDNNNSTLPDGMDISDEVLFDMSLYKLELKKQKIFRIVQDIDDINSEVKIICIFEYDVKKP